MTWNKFKLDTAKNQPLYQLLANQLRQLIVSGQLLPGQKLPSSRELQKLLFVSAITIESGLNFLVEEGFLCRRPRCGTFVTDVLPDAGAKIDPPKSIYAIFSNMKVAGYWFLVLGELERLCREAGYQLCFHQQEAGTGFPVEIASYRNCAGIVLCGYNSLAFTNEIRKRKVPVVLIGSLDTESDSEENLDMVVHNDRERAMISTMHLLDLGHRRIACVTGPGHSKFSAKQKAGFLDAMKEYDLVPDASDFYDVSNLEYEDGVKAGYEIFCRRNRPTAIYAGNDRVAIGIIATAEKLGLSVPEELSIIGCGGLSFGGVPHKPALTTTVSLPKESARIAAEKLFRQIGEPDALRGTTVVRVDTICFGETTIVSRPGNAVVFHRAETLPFASTQP